MENSPIIETQKIEKKVAAVKKTSMKLTDDEIVAEIDRLSKVREATSYEIKKLKNRINARRFKAKKSEVQN